jgi:hypothetical protein
VPSSKTTKPGTKQVNWRLPLELKAYIERWAKATGEDQEDIAAHMIRAYKEAVGEPPKPTPLPPMPKPPKQAP